MEWLYNRFDSNLKILQKAEKIIGLPNAPRKNHPISRNVYRKLAKEFADRATAEKDPAKELADIRKAIEYLRLADAKEEMFLYARDLFRKFRSSSNLTHRSAVLFEALQILNSLPVNPKLIEMQIILNGLLNIQTKPETLQVDSITFNKNRP